MKNIILDLLTNAFDPVYLNLQDESAQHADHNPSAKVGGTHFNLLIVSEKFIGKSRIERHRMVYKILHDQLRKRIHALGLTALTPEEFNSSHK